MVAVRIVDGLRAFRRQSMYGDGDPGRKWGGAMNERMATLLFSLFMGSSIAWAGQGLPSLVRTVSMAVSSVTDSVVVLEPTRICYAAAVGGGGDRDGDGDIDVLSASINDDTIAWYENTDGGEALGRAE